MLLENLGSSVPFFGLFLGIPGSATVFSFSTRARVSKKRRAKTQSKSERNVLGVFAVLFLVLLAFLLAPGKKRKQEC